MYKLTKKEEELMQIFWERGPMFVKDIVPLYDEPKPHFNTRRLVIPIVIIL